MQPANIQKLTRGPAFAALAAEYRRIVEDLATRLRPRFESGALYGWDHPGERPGETEQLVEHPAHLLEDEVYEAIQDFPLAYVVLACSPSEDSDADGSVELSSARSEAATCLVVDVFRLARERGWWRPGPGEWIGPSEWRALREARSASSTPSAPPDAP